ncbi:hypothetical protein KY362_03040, partial [Candidatus Woesearchaeota archaeon]|nr:hypothetical protein [Candidatus Woesearchaeota archaeon]
MDRNSVSVLLGALFVVLFALYVGVTSMPAIRASLEQRDAVPPPEVRVLPVPEEPVELAAPEESVPEPVPKCMPPYIEDGDGCCIDNDYDYVCDPDVSPTKISVNCDRCDDGNPCTYEVCVEDRCIVTCRAG